MSKNSFWDLLGNSIETALFIKFGIPFIIIVIVILLGVAMINKSIVASHVDKEHSILITEFKDTIYDIAKDKLNNNEFDLSISNSEFYDVDLEYTIKNKNHSSEEYEELFKQEITKIYNEIKDKQLVNDTLFGKDENLEYNEIHFSINYNNEYYSWLGGTEMKYSFEDKWDSGYKDVMKNVIIEKDTLDEVKNKEKNHNLLK